MSKGGHILTAILSLIALVALKHIAPGVFDAL